MKKNWVSILSVSMPVLMIATYGDDNVVDVMNMAWAVSVPKTWFLSTLTRITRPQRTSKARCVHAEHCGHSHIEAADFFGIASGNKMPDKFERSGLSAVKAKR